MRIILIGPMGIGKSSVSKILASKMNFNHIEVDELREEMYVKIEGFSKEKERELAKKDQNELFLYWKPFEVKQLELIIANYDNAIIDVGGGHVVQEDKQLSSRIEELLNNEKFVFNLYYSFDKEEEIDFLSKRDDIPQDALPFYNELNKKMILANKYEKLAKYQMCVKNKTYEMIADEIINIVKKV